ncbi:hypothetical protein ACWD6R_20910 [Streptomyces sp. NPDC005151]
MSGPEPVAELQHEYSGKGPPPACGRQTAVFHAGPVPPPSPGKRADGSRGA